MTCGIWREARIEAWGGPVLRDVFIRQDRVAPEAAELAAVVEVEAAAAWEGRLRVSAGEAVWERQVALEAGTAGGGAAAELGAAEAVVVPGLGGAGDVYV